jgi:hypothetical protein
VMHRQRCIQPRCGGTKQNWTHFIAKVKHFHRFGYGSRSFQHYYSEPPVPNLLNIDILILPIVLFKAIMASKSGTRLAQAQISLRSFIPLSAGLMLYSSNPRQKCKIPVR